MNQVLITGSNRGLGLERARQYGNDSFRVYGADFARLLAC
jgi:NAD(P)-dependent dehydrogenase (short-subunit alcohol dehydrogenase family)